jgi:spore coat protein E
MEEIKKIFAKAAYGQGTKSFRKEIHIHTHERKRPAEILGILITDAEIISCTFEGDIKNGKAVRVNGTFDVHLWYALNGDTNAAKVNTKFSDIVMVYGQDAGKFVNEEVRAWIQKAPKCAGTSIINDSEEPGVAATVKYELGAEIVGQTTLNVKVIYMADVSKEDEEIPMENEEITDEYEDD